MKKINEGDRVTKNAAYIIKDNGGTIERVFMKCTRSECGSSYGCIGECELYIVRKLDPLTEFLQHEKEKTKFS